MYDNPLLFRYTLSLPDFVSRELVMRKFSIVACGLFLFVALTVGAARFSHVLHGFMAQPSDILLQDEHGHVNILLLGVGDADHSGANLTDTMIVASLDPHTPSSVVLLSIPRDMLFMNAKGMSEGKINSLYADYTSHFRYQKMKDAEASRSALQQLTRVIGEKTGVSLPYYVKADFTAFTQLIDSVGGIDVDVPKKIVDYAYPLQEGVVGTYEILPGVHHMNGEDALKYVRTRHSSTDFDRSARQQQVLSLLSDAMKKKAADNPEYLLSLYGILHGNVETNLSTDELVALGRSARSLSSDRFITMQLNFHSGGNGLRADAGGFLFAPPISEYGSASVLLPIATSPKFDSWSDIRTFARMLTRDRDVYLAHQNFIVRSAGASYAAASELMNELSRYGFSVSEQKKEKDETVSVSAQSSVCYAAGQKQQQRSALYLSALLRVTAKECASTSSGVVIELGKSYKFIPLVVLSGSTLSPAPPSTSA